MKSLMILGGLIGFGLGLGVGLAHGGAWPDVFWRASVAALLAGLVLRWWGRVWVRSLQESFRERGAGGAKPDPVSTPNRAKV
jgi:L-asparagine transporter-like permease